MSSAPALLSAFVLTILFAPAASGQATITVPGDELTIQAGIVAAADGDTVLVAPGTWREQIDFLGKAIVVQSSDGPGVTTIDAQGAGPVARFVTAEDNDSVLRGFRITGGVGATVPQPDVFGPPTIEAGGGVLCLGTSPRIEHCLLVGNVAGDAGAGLYKDHAGAGFVPDAVTLVDCLLLDNRTTNGGAYGGAGAAAFYAPLVLERCVVRGNTTAGCGGGVLQRNAKLLLTDSLLERNTADSCGGGVSVGMSLFSSVSGMTATRTRFIDNHTDGPGGGVDFSTTGDPVVGGGSMVDCVLARNSAGGDGGGLRAYVDDATALFPTGFGLTRVLVARNTAGGQGGGASVGQSDMHSRYERVTFADNASGGTGSALDLIGTFGAPDLRDCIVWGNGPGAPFDGGFGITYSDVQGGQAGIGNIDADPLFVDAAHLGYSLRAGSPAVDVGDPSAPLDPDGSTADLGAFAYGPWCDLYQGLYGGAGVPQLDGSGSLAPGSPVTLTLTGGVSGAAASLVIGGGALGVPFKGGTFLPTFDFLVPGLPLDALGELTLVGAWPPGLPAGAGVWFQCWLPDAIAPAGYSATNGLLAVQP